MVGSSRNRKKWISGFSLLEIVIALGIFTIVVGSIGVISADTLRGFKNDEARTEAYMQLQSITNLLMERKADVWPDFVLYTDAGQKQIDLVNGDIVITDGVRVQNNISSWFEIEPVSRDGTGSIVDVGGTVDPYSREVTINMQWEDWLNRVYTLDKVIYVNDWNTAKWMTTTEAEFNTGTYFQTTLATIGDGAVGLATLLYPDWCNPALTLTAHDIPGNGDARTVTAIAGNAYMGTGGNASGTAFSHVEVTGVENPTVIVEGTYDTSKVNDIYVDTTGNGDYAYLATDNNAQEVMILDIVGGTYDVIGWFNGYKSLNGEAVAVSGHVGLLGQDDYLSSFDTSSVIGERSELDRLKLQVSNGSISDIVIVGDHAYLSIQNTTIQLMIVDISDPNNLTVTGSGSINSYQANKLYVRDDGNRVYIGTEDNTGDDFYILDTSDKAGPWATVGSYDTNGMSINSLTLVENGALAVLVGNGGEEYQVVRITDETNPTRCGGLEFPVEVYDIVSVEDSEDNAYSYAVTEDSADEFKIVRGGPGGGWGGGYGYAQTGTYTSSIYDTGDSATVYYLVMWIETKTAPTDLQFQVRASNNADMSGSTWVGPDGTANTYFTTAYGEFLPDSLNFNRYIQFRGYLSGDSVESPVLEELSILYQN